MGLYDTESVGCDKLLYVHTYRCIKNKQHNISDLIQDAPVSGFHCKHCLLYNGTHTKSLSCREKHT